MHVPQALTAAALTMLAAVAPAVAQPVTIDFSSYASPTSRQWQATFGAPVASQGFEFYDAVPSALTGSTSNALGTWGTDPADLGSVNRPSNIGAATTLFAPNNGDRIDLVRADLGPFSLLSMDVAHLFRQSSISPPLGGLNTITLRFEYFGNLDDFNNDVATGFQTFSIPAPPLVGGDRVPFLNHLVFGSGFRSVLGVRWYQASGITVDQQGNITGAIIASGRDHQFTNVVLQAVPEPATYATLGTGLLVLGLGALRRRRAA